MKKYIPVFTLAILLPVVAAAQGQDVMSLWGYLLTLITSVTKLVWVLTILTFLWGLVMFMKNAESEGERKKAKEMMIGSVVAFFIAVSFWGLVTFAIKAFNLVPDAAGTLPTTRSS